LTKKNINNVVKCVFEYRTNLICEVSHLLLNIQKKCGEFDPSLVTKDESSLMIKLFYAGLCTLRNYNLFEKAQEMIIKFEKCNNCYSNICDKTNLCTDMIHIMNYIVSNENIKNIKTLYRLIYQLRETNYRIIEIDYSLLTASLDDLSCYKSETFSDFIDSTQLANVVDYDSIKTIDTR
jgi:hypothetical protein